jgi:eukaryotic-like serine/threonine-protein kinase
VLIAEDGRVVVTDFGLARAEPASSGAASPDLPGPAAPSETRAERAERERRDDAREALTDHGGIVGTLGFISPEQARGEECDARSDQFSFFATLYFALYGEAPIREKSLNEYLRAVEAGPIEPPALHGVPPWLRGVIRKGLSRRPSDRYPGMPSALAALSKDPRLVVGRTSVVAAVAAAAVAWNFARQDRTALDACDDGGQLV